MSEAKALLADGVKELNLISQDSTYGQVLAGIKAALDPNGILAPGRYEVTSQRNRELIEA